MGNNLSSTFIQSFPIIREKRNSRIARIEVNFLIKRINGKEEREREEEEEEEEGKED